jgi:iron-sulfur cluster assembly accessory protein
MIVDTTTNGRSSVGGRNPERNRMIELTETAAGKVKELLEEEGRNDIALRVAVQPGGCSGLRYAMYLDDQLSEKDVSAEQFGVRLVVDKMSVPYLAEAKIDFVDSLEASGFTIDNPVAQSSCACGNSFH